MPATQNPTPENPPQPGSIAPPDATATGSQAEFESFLPLANALAAGEVVPMRADLQLALHNVTVGVENVLAERSRAAKLPETNLGEIEELPRLVLAVLFADTQVERVAPQSDIGKSLARARELRALLLATAEALALVGALPPAKVKEIRKGRGSIDAARDCVDLAALFRKYAADIRGKHAITAEQIEECGTVGTTVFTQLKAHRARTGEPTKRDGADTRDRLWTLVVQRAHALFRVGAYLFGREDVDAKVPPLQAHRSSPKKAAHAPTPAAPSK
jgi:hypothetical protein